MTDEHEHHDHSHEHSHSSSSGSGVRFSFGGKDYVVPLGAAEDSGIVGSSDRIQLPDGQLILLHPHAHEDNANNVESIEEKGGKVWPVD